MTAITTENADIEAKMMYVRCPMLAKETGTTSAMTKLKSCTYKSSAQFEANQSGVLLMACASLTAESNTVSVLACE